jgi:hypothetical protein
MSFMPVPIAGGRRTTIHLPREVGMWVWKDPW